MRRGRRLVQLSYQSLLLPLYFTSLNTGLFFAAWWVIFSGTIWMVRMANHVMGCLSLYCMYVPTNSQVRVCEEGYLPIGEASRAKQSKANVSNGG